jgi:16S rRNA (guanine(966)-N(2))-methyltransferase RsmD
MRIIAGSARGRQLRSLKSGLRPTADRVRESLFSILAPRIEGARFLDLYAGVGTVGLEALSRGAAEAVFVESHRPAARLIGENAALCGLADRAEVIYAPVERGLALLRRRSRQFDLIFIDPPYERGEVPGVLGRLAQQAEMLAEKGLLICQHSRHEEAPEQIGPFGRMRRVRFGETIVDMYERREVEGGNGEIATVVGRLRTFAQQSNIGRTSSFRYSLVF